MGAAETAYNQLGGDSSQRETEYESKLAAPPCAYKRLRELRDLLTSNKS